MKKCSSRQIVFRCWLLIFVLLIGCSSNSTEPEPEPEYKVGENHFTTAVDGDTREYYVHVPAIYNKNTATPVVFMLHGASGDGGGAYRNLGWKELAETENFIAVFPTAWSYCWIKNNGTVRDTTRWNSLPGIFTFCQGMTSRDDVKFLRQVVAELQQKFNVDSKKIYVAGFSSGAQMAFRCGVEMSDVFAAIVQSGGTHSVDAVFTPIRNLPVWLEIGNEDETWFTDGIYPSIALFDSMLTNYWLFRRIVKVHAQSFDFETTYTMTGDANSMQIATFKGIPYVRNREFKFSFINELDHSYPNSVNHPIYGAEMHWNWMQQYSLQ